MLTRLDKMKNRKKLQHKEFQIAIANNNTLLQARELEIGNYKSQFLLINFLEDGSVN